MRKTVTAILCFFLTMCCLTPVANACTTILVGGDASTDGSRIIGRTMDAGPLMPMQLVTVPAADGEGTWVFEDEVNGLKVELPVKAYQYTATRSFPSIHQGVNAESCVNSEGVCISATETIRTKDELVALDPFVKNGVAERSMPTLVIPYVSTAREGVKLLANWVERDGAASAEAVIFADSSEIWYMEIYTAHQWAAMRMPEDCYAVIANDAILGRMDVSDTQNVMASKDIVELPQKAGLLCEVDGLPHLAMTYGPELRDYSQIRLWTGRRYFNPGTAGKYIPEQRYEAFVKPEKPIALAQVLALSRDRMEGTPYDANTSGTNKRPIGIDRTAQSHFLQIRGDKPTVYWLCLANPELSVYLPFYGNLTSVPDAYSLDCDGYNPDSAFWAYRSLASLGALNRETYGAEVRKLWNETETKLIAGLDAMDAAYEASGRSGDKAAELFQEISDAALADAHAMHDKLLTQLSADTIESTINLGKDIP